MSPPAYLLRRRGLLPWRPAGGPAGFVEHLGWLSERSLVVFGWLDAASAATSVTFEVVAGGVAESAVAAVDTYGRPDLEALAEAVGVRAVVPLERLGAPCRRLEALALQVRGRWFRWLPRHGKEVAPDLVTVLESVARDWPAELASRVAGALASAAADEHERVGGADAVLLRNAAALLRLFGDSLVGSLEPRSLPLFTLADPSGTLEVPAPPPPRPEPALVEGTCRVEPSQPFGLAVEAVLRTDAEHVLVQAWLWDPERRVTGCALLAPDAGLAALERMEPSFPRADVAEVYRPSYGRVADRAQSFWLCGRAPWIDKAHELLLGLEQRGRPEAWFQTPPLIVDPFLGRETLFSGLPTNLRPSPDLLQGPITVAARQLSESCRLVSSRPAPHVDWDFRTTPQPITLSLIVPMVDTEYLEPQLTAFAEAPERSAFEVVAVADVADAAEIETRLFRLARHLDLAVRLVLPGARRGWAAAVEAGARLARGRALGILHADVVLLDREAIGWLLRELERGAAAAGPALEAEDGAVAGGPITFRRDLFPDGGLAPYVRGLGLQPQRAGITWQTARALSGAAFFVSRESYFEAGGLLDVYPAGDGDELDLFLRLGLDGRPIVYQPAARMLHAARGWRSEGPGWRRNAWSSLYGRLLLTERWAAVLEPGSAAETASSEAAGVGAP